MGSYSAQILPYEHSNIVRRNQISVNQGPLKTVNDQRIMLVLRATKLKNRELGTASRLLNYSHLL